VYKAFKSLIKSLVKNISSELLSEKTVGSGSGFCWLHNRIPVCVKNIWKGTDYWYPVFRKKPRAKMVVPVQRNAGYEAFNSSDKIYIVRKGFRLTVE